MKRIHASGSLKEDLRELRERAGLTIEEASAGTKILASIIRAWERGDWFCCHSDKLYIERMVIAYVGYFGGRTPFFQKKIREELHDLPSDPVRAKIIAMQPFQGFDVKWGARLRLGMMFAALVFGLGFYMVAQAKAIAEPPALEILSPKDRAVLNSPIAQIEGKTEPETMVYINERQVALRKDGTFALELDVARGTTEIVVRAKKRHSRESTATVHVIYERDVERAQEL